MIIFSDRRRWPTSGRGKRVRLRRPRFDCRAKEKVLREYADTVGVEEAGFILKIQDAQKKIGDAGRALSRFPTEDYYLSDFVPVVVGGTLTDADGRFTMRCKSEQRVALFARASRLVGKFSERYLWFLWLPSNEAVTLLLSNHNSAFDDHPENVLPIPPKREVEPVGVEPSNNVVAIPTERSSVPTQTIARRDAIEKIYRELVKLRAATESGVTYQKYSDRLIDARAGIESASSDAGQFKESALAVLDAYQAAKDFWGRFIRMSTDYAPFLGREHQQYERYGIKFSDQGFAYKSDVHTIWRYANSKLSELSAQLQQNVP
jgi:hypothetical protein